MGQSQIRSGRLGEVFNVGEARHLNAKLARLSVLYEDLRVEVYGIAEPSIPALDILDLERDNRFTPDRIGRYRRYYFVRRSIGTLREFAEALRLINLDPDLQFNVTQFVEGVKATWDSATEFFERNEALLKAIRNDIGGHFGHGAALNALDKVQPGAFSTVELVDGKGFRLHFAGEIAASALLPHLQDEDIAEYEALLRECIKPAYRHGPGVCRYSSWSIFGRGSDAEELAHLSVSSTLLDAPRSGGF